MLTQSCSWFPVGEYELGVPVLGVESKLPPTGGSLPVSSSFWVIVKT
jgi:hypothetical protein